jgi:hypothetical protein
MDDCAGGEKETRGERKEEMVREGTESYGRRKLIQDG